MGTSPRLSDLVPRRGSTFLFTFLGGVTVVAGLAALYGLGEALAPLTTDGKIAAFDLDSEGSIGNWVSVVVLFLCGLTTLLVRSIERSLADGARPTRLWLAVSGVWFTMSLDEGASLHEGFKELMARLCHTRILGDGSIYWAVPYFVLLSASGLFLLWRARRVPAAIAFLFAAGAFYAIAVASQMELILRGMGPIEVCVEESCETLGHLSIWMTLGLYARSLVLSLDTMMPVQRQRSVPAPKLHRTIAPSRN